MSPIAKGRPEKPPDPADDLDRETYHKITKFVYDHARITLGENKMELIRARLGKIIRQKNMSGYRAYYKWMSEDKTGEAVREVMNAVATNLTAFFRENKHFDYLANQLLPSFARSGERRLRAWSAGCSTGQEVYTIAMTILENLPQADSQYDIKLLATDIDTDVVRTGATGIYSQDAVKGIPDALLRRYFQPGATDQRGRPGWKVGEELRRLVSFRFLNLFSQWPFRGRFDFIFCRNVMIYFDRPTQEQLLNRYWEQLRPGGTLFIGHSESLNGINHQYEYVLPTIYRRPK